MEHVRTAALRRVVANLGGIPGVVSVRATRRWSHVPEDCPAIAAHWVLEQHKTADAGRPGQRMQTRDMGLRVCIIIAQPELPGDEPLEYELDALQAEVEARMAADPHLVVEGRPLARDVKLQRVESGEATKAAQTVVVTALTYSVTTSHREGQPTAPLARPGA